MPDFTAVANRYCTSGNIAELTGLVCGGQRTEFDYHFIIFDRSSLQTLLESIGFTDVQPWNWRCADHGFLDD